ncbi:phosphoglucosamine mutase [Dermatobacter hominis]|uniref:phosphoglucosamine mutase n=1 Tax=Dermatobacter hominis TaxID=2884263 RepID=UPI001D112509|nr:phosphoglucosamine mutase [Dermatobacter hominis]UDY33856.1 phosphoglucosamine mutase [Dermatobacter hominis]
MTVRFGTDGVRGVAGRDLTPEIALAIGRAAVRAFGARRVVIGRDTRRSGPLLEAALAAGVCAEGADAVLAGVVPTPAVAFASERDQVVGVVISASHNAYADNGIKLFAPGGLKLSDDQQAAVEAVIADALSLADHAGEPLDGAPVGAEVGSLLADVSLADDYAASIEGVTEGRRLDGLRVVVDCANGAVSAIAPDVLADLGAEVLVLFAEPDGTNINDGCGSTHPEALQRAVVEERAHLGLAFDGDADRLLAVDERGRLVDGDQILALCATDLRDRGRLSEDTVVVTVMSNLGFRQAMGRQGITVVETAVGDRYVLAAMADGGFSLGGEQSGHLVFGDLGTTGDGLLSAVVLADLVVREGAPLGDLVDAAMTKLPQVLRNVRVGTPMPDVADRLSAEVAEVSAELGDRGRVLLRPSGTEPVVRVMAEAPTEAEAAAAVDTLVAAVESLA